MPRLVLILAVLIAGCADDAPPAETYDVRGRVVAFAFGGEAVVVDHEDIPGYMDAMRMSLRPQDPSLIAELEPGDRIAFRLVLPETGSPYIDQIATLPPDTELELAPPDTSRSGG